MGLVFRPTERQEAALDALDDPGVRDVCYGGAKGGGKSHLLCVWALCQAWDIAHEHGLKQCKTVPHVGWIGRKQAADFVQTTLDTWQRVILPEYYELKTATDRYPRHILIDGRVAIDYGGLDRQETISKFNSAEYAFIGVDQAEETTREDVATLKASRRMTIKGKALPYKGLWTANPASCWLKEDFIDSPEPHCRFVQALPGDNPYLPADYEQTLRESFGFRPELLQAYLYGSWDLLAGADQVIQGQWLTVAAGKTLHGQYKRPRLVCDTAGEGDDETVIYYGGKTDVDEAWYMGYTSVPDIATKLAELSVRHDRCPIWVEATGGDLGKGVLDVLAVQRANVRRYTPQGKPSREIYGNMRAEVWCTAARMLQEGRVELKWGDKTLRSQLCTARYRVKGNKTFVEPKADIKKRLSRSPDRADAYVMLLWSYDKSPVKDDAFWEPEGVGDEMANSYSVVSVL